MCGLKMVSPSDATKAKLQEFLPAAASFGNPIDVHRRCGTGPLYQGFELAQDDENIDAIVVVVTPQNMTAAAANWRSNSPQPTMARSRC